MDWLTNNVNRKEVCIVLDDSSRRILSGVEFDAATAENSIELIREVLEKFEAIRRTEEVITDRSSQFYANKKDKNGNSESSFEAFLKESDIKHIKARVKHRQMGKSKNGMICTKSTDPN